MKRGISLLLALSLLASLLSGCQQPAAETEPLEQPGASTPAVEVTCKSIVSTIWRRAGTGAYPPAGVYYGMNFNSDALPERSPEEMALYIEGAYGLAEDEWEEAAIILEGGMSAMEVAVLRFADEDAAKRGEECLNGYLPSREIAFTGYAPAQAKLVSGAKVVREGCYAGLFIVEETGYAGEVFVNMLRTGEVPEPTPFPEPVTIDDVAVLLDRILEEYSVYYDLPELERVDSSDPERLSAILEEYQLAGYPLEEAAVARAVGDSVVEFAALRITPEWDGSHLLDTLNWEYLDVKEDGFTGPADQAEILSEAYAGNPMGSQFVILAVCESPARACISAADFLGVVGTIARVRHFDPSAPVPTPTPDPDPNYPDRTRYTDPGMEDMSIRDTSAIRSAWAAGDPSELSSVDREVYEAAKTILGQILQDSMTDLEKEKAIYHWVVNEVGYDWGHMDVMAEVPRASYEPYGGLVNRAAMCLGYATSFQLLMDLAGVECITVVGASAHSQAEHAWNIVRLNGEWYCVDVTWDSNFREQGTSDGQAESWRYFNVTSDEMAATDHQWDYVNTPEATAEDHGQT